MTVSRILRRLSKAPSLVRRFGLVQTGLLLLPEIVRATPLAGLSVRSLGKAEARFRLRDSTVLWFRPFSMDLGIFHEVWDHERYTKGRIGRLARDGIVVDIGAHIGLFSVFASRALGANRIVSVEPDLANFRLLDRNIRANQVHGATLVEAAVAGRSGERRIYLDPSNTGGDSIRPRSVSSRSVRVFSLKKLFDSEGISRCSLLKMDCEGAEMEVLESAQDKLLENVSSLSMEYHLDAYPVDRLLHFKSRIEALGFKTERLATSSMLGILRGTRSE